MVKDTILKYTGIKYQSLTRFTVTSSESKQTGRTSCGYVAFRKTHCTVTVTIISRQTSGAAGAEITITYAFRAIFVRVKVSGQTCLTESCWVPSW